MFCVIIIRKSFIFQCQSEVFSVNEPSTNSFAKDLGKKRKPKKLFIFFIKTVPFQANQSITACAGLLKRYLQPYSIVPLFEWQQSSFYIFETFHSIFLAGFAMSRAAKREHEKIKTNPRKG